jgi:hypothetical protein
VTSRIDFRPLALRTLSFQATVALLSIREPFERKAREYYITLYRKKLASLLMQFRDCSNRQVVLSGEGIGKTSCVLPIILREAEDDAMEAPAGIHPFAAIAVRSNAQAELKASEFRAAGYKVLVWRSLFAHYKEVCQRLNETPIPRHSFHKSTVVGILRQIRKKHPTVFVELDKVRAGLWGQSGFSSFTTLLVTTHGTVRTWDSARLTRAWHNPGFNLNSTPEDERGLADEIRLQRVVFDDPEADDFFHCIPEEIFKILQKVTQRHPNWRNQKLAHRKRVHSDLRASLPPLLGDYDRFNELMRVPLSPFQPISVDFSRNPFGGGNSQKCIYRERDGRRYFLAPKPWVGADRHMTFLTTEKVVAKTIAAIMTFARQRQLQTGRARIGVPISLNLDDLPGIYPLQIPVKIDARSSKRHIEELVDEIVDGDRGCLVVTDMVRSNTNVLNYQQMKGANGHQQKNVHVVMTSLSPEKYSELNVLGQWLGIDNIIAGHYFDQLAQAVGRNTGFRQASETATTTMVYTSSKVWRSVLSNPSRLPTRVILYQVSGPSGNLRPPVGSVPPKHASPAAIS